MRKRVKKNFQKIPIEIEFAEGYEQRFTAAILKIYSDRKNAAADREKDRAAS